MKYTYVAAETQFPQSPLLNKGSFITNIILSSQTFTYIVWRYRIFTYGVEWERLVLLAGQASSNLALARLQRPLPAKLEGSDETYWNCLH